MGFNKRQFLVGTLPGNHDQYEITQPLDGKWGAQMENGSWNGLIGQLERLDIDLVAAPVAVQISREKVVDFTIPYYYDSPAILLKKPDQNAKKWRTLIDPLSEYVILCIFIFLPVISLFLFFFEKCTPYYRRIENRDKVRGLHHFSDSLWYVMNAIFENGLLQKWKLEHWPKHGICDNIPRKESTPITLIDIHSSFYVVAIGVFIASSFLICESFKWRYQRKRLMQDKGKQTSHETDIVRMKSSLEDSMIY
ncbi:glutamate receptor ionotropic, kainate glr-3-like [Mytilus galloprovincialis]|uniref:glutamate receptor ionotropic, kainate glr-3-like n=1 Tax=Mytilus galloprovincialis TaxID=29158 RepID=UPI003F7B6AB0